MEFSTVGYLITIPQHSPGRHSQVGKKVGIMSLRDSWITGREHRHQELLQRQQTVQQTLADYGQARQHMATHLWGDLAIFREELLQQDQARRSDFQQLHAELQHYCQSLQHNTREFLAATAADRDLMAQQLTTELSAFHAELQANVRSLRAQMQADLAMLQADTQAFLNACQDQRFRTNAETRRSLTHFMDSMRADVEQTLADFAQARWDRADQLHQDLHQSRVDREAEVAALFERLAQFRAELGEFHSSLTETVWGQNAPSRPSRPPELVVPRVATAAAFTSPPVSAIAAKPAPAKPQPSRTAPPKSNPPSRAGSAAVPPRGTRTVPKAAAKATTASRTVTAAKVAPAAASPAPANGAAPALPAEVAFEKEVYTFLHEQQGARLTQIETALKLNRFQAVDALRSLIKKGLITQRDRVYLTQEQS